MKLLLAILLTTISLNAYSFCAWDDHDCNARQAEQDKMQRELDYQRSEMQRQQQEFDRQQDQMRLDEQRLEFDKEAERKRDWHNDRTDAIDVIQDLDGD